MTEKGLYQDSHMTDVFSREKRSEVMARIKSTGNRETELSLAQFFRRYDIIGWRRKAAVFGHPDFVFYDLRLAIFVDGCFWHGCPIHGTSPKTNQSYWGPKLERNRNRDNNVNRSLHARGWHVLRIWQHELSPKNEKRLLRRLSRHLSPRKTFC